MLAQGWHNIAYVDPTLSQRWAREGQFETVVTTTAAPATVCDAGPALKHLVNFSCLLGVS